MLAYILPTLITTFINKLIFAYFPLRLPHPAHPLIHALPPLTFL